MDIRTKLIIPLSQWVDDVISVFVPYLCLSCENPVAKNMNGICFECRKSLEFVYCDYENNELLEHLEDLYNLRFTGFLLKYPNNEIVRNLMHELKYKGKEHIGSIFGHWLGKLISNQLSGAIDIVCIVPCHKKRLRKRGYNQVDLFAKTLCSYIKKAIYEPNLLIKRINTSSQVTKKGKERWFDVNPFELNEKFLSLKNKRILLVDDLITTGNTISNCLNVLQKIKGVQMSVISIIKA